MTLTPDQLEQIVARACPGRRLAGSQPLARGRWALELAGGEQLHLHLFDSPAEAATATAALRLLRGEVDLPVPHLRAADTGGGLAGRPYALTSALPGEPLGALVGRLPEQALYDLGRRLGELAGRLHRVAPGRFGALAPEAGAQAEDERGLAQARLEADLERCGALGLLSRQGAEAIRAWFAQMLQPVARPPALLHGGLRPELILVRRAESGWRLSGLLGWEGALAWSPAWEHVVFLDGCADPRLFSLRVGYGNAYDDQTRRTYEQVREPVLRPYRMLLALRRTAEAHERGDFAAAERARNGALTLLEVRG